jgi:hypothetical protein
MNINARQLTLFDVTRMDVTTALGFFGQIKAQLDTNATLTATMAGVWTAYAAALQAYDDAYAQARRWEQTEDISALDTQRDMALSAYLNALKAMTASPNAQKQQAAKQLMFIREKYSLSASDEYMKETTAIRQMVQEMDASAEAQAALATTGLDDWFVDLKQKNEDFLAKMNERTDAQAGQQKGVVREARLACEAAYRNVVKLVNALSIVEVPAGLDYAPVIDRLNAEIEHYRQILARKGVTTGTSSGGSSSNGGGTTEPENPGTGGDTTPTTPDTPGTGTDTPGTDTPGTDTPGTDTPGTGGDNTGGGTDPDHDPWGGTNSDE